MTARDGCILASSFGLGICWDGIERSLGGQSAYIHIGLAIYVAIVAWLFENLWRAG